MLPKPTDLLLKQKVKLYSNIAKSGDCVGCLHAELQVYPSPRITWEFESLGDTACEPKKARRKLENPLVGSWFSIEEPYVGRQSWGTVVGQPRVSLGGAARQAHYGDLDNRFHSFTFYLPNARFQEKSLEGQKRVEKLIKVEGREGGRDAGRATEGWFITVSIDNTWNIRLETRQEALTWLASNQNNIGTLITTVGRLYHPKDDESRPKEMTETPTLAMGEAQERLNVLSRLLSFANGGYLGPLFIKGARQSETDLEFAATVLAYETTPLEQLGTSWITMDSDLGTYMRCFTVLGRMLSTSPWDEVFNLILIWYFQAIQPSSAQIRGKPWPVVANAVGAALERLSVTILVKELNIRGLGSRERIGRLLEQAGITKSQVYVDKFLDIRNDATHPRPTTTMSTRERNQVVNRAIQWTEEVLLWRLGYNGKYRNRLAKHYASTEPRYDLNTRDPSW